MRLLLVDADARRSGKLRAAIGEAGGVLHCCGEPPMQRWVLEEHFDAVLLVWARADHAAGGWLRLLRQAGYIAPVLALLGAEPSDAEPLARSALQAEEMIQAIESGADDCLLPPYLGAEALARVRLAVTRGRSNGHRRVTLGDVRIDLDDRRVFQRQQAVTLTASEWALLEALATRPGRTVPRSQLEALLDDRPAHLLSNRLEVHIAHLRRKLGRELILTVRGMGYRCEG